MNRLIGFAVFLLCYWAGQYLAARFGLSVPGNVLGMVLLLMALLLMRGVPKALEVAAPPLLNRMVLFLMPAAIGLMTLGPLLRREGTMVIVIMVVSTLVPLYVLGVGLDRVLMRRRRGGQHGAG